MSLVQFQHESYGRNDLVRITAATTLHEFEVGQVVAIVGTVQRSSDQSIFHVAVDEDGNQWGVTDSEITMFDKYNPEVDDELLGKDETLPGHVHVEGDGHVH
jgi:hypothetical protein